jgi:cytidyltransferase-like protein
LKIYPIGSAHGRFQPLHKGHIEYLIASKKFCNFLKVGITQCYDDSLLKSPKDPHRQEPSNNPMTYSERAEMIREALIDEGLQLNEFEIIHFPIEIPENIKNILSTNIPIFTTIYDKWNKHKIKLLKKLGYQVITLWERKIKQFDGMKIRDMIYAGDERWKKEVPIATIRAIEKYGIRDRLIKMKKDLKIV